MRSTNPALARDPFSKAQSGNPGEVMTIEGSINKSGVLISLAILSAALTWNYLRSIGFIEAGMSVAIILAPLFAGFICALVIIFKPTTAPLLSPVYALLEGVVLGAITMSLEQLYPGIAMQAVVGTFGVFVLMLVTYRSGLIKVTDKFRSIISMAIGGVMLIYLVSFVGSFFGFNMPYIHDGGPIGIGFSVVVCGIAAFSLLLDFDLIEQGARKRAPKYMEWYTAFALLVTLVWLYLEILRLLGKARR